MTIDFNMKIPDFNIDTAVHELKGSHLVVAYVEVGTLPPSEALHFIDRVHKRLKHAVSEWVPDKQVLTVPIRDGEFLTSIEVLNLDMARAFLKNLDHIRGSLADRIATLEGAE